MELRYPEARSPSGFFLPTCQT